MTQLARWLAAGALVLPLWGCGSLHLYNKEADTAATGAKEDYDASKVGQALKAERAMFDALETKELEAFRKVTLARRDLELLSLVSESGTAGTRTTGDGLVARFNRLADARLLELSGPTADAAALARLMDQAKRDLRDATLKEKQARSQLLLFHPKFAALPACSSTVAALDATPTAEAAAALTRDPAFKPADIPASAGWGPAIKKLGAECAGLLKAGTTMDTALAQASAGALGRAIAAASAQEEGLKARRQDAEDARRDLKKAATELAAAEKAAKAQAAPPDLACELSRPASSTATTPAAATSTVAAGAATPAATTPAAASATVAAAGGKQAGPTEKKSALCEVLARLAKLGDAGVKIVSEERLDRINSILQALSGQSPAAATDQESVEPALALLSATSRFAQALRQYHAAGTLPALEPLLIEKQLASAQLAYAEAGEALSKDRLRYAQLGRDASFQEVDLLLQAKAELGALGMAPHASTRCNTGTAVFCASMRQLLEDKAFAQQATAGESASRRAYRAMALLSETYSVSRDRQQTAELQLILADYRESLLRSEASVAAWNTLVSVPIDQLKAYHAGGVTAQDVAQLLQALGVIGIAVRIK